MIFIDDESIAESPTYQCCNCSLSKYCDDDRGLRWGGCVDCKLSAEGKERIALQKAAEDEARMNFFSVLITRVDEVLAEIALMQTAMHLGKKSAQAETALSLATEALNLARIHMC